MLNVYEILHNIFALTSVEEKKRSTSVSLEESRKKVKDEISDLKDKLNLARETIDQFKTALANANKQPGPGTPTSRPKKSGSMSSEPVAGTSKSVTIKLEDFGDSMLAV